MKDYDFFSFERKCGNKYGNKLKDTATKTGIDAAKKVAQKKSTGYRRFNWK